MFVALLAAAALAPTGFTENTTLSARAAWVAQKPVRVYCAPTDAAWNAYVEQSGVAISDVHGLTPVIGGDEVYIDADGCRTLVARIKGRRVLLAKLGAVIDVLAHEAIHSRGESDEGKTECAAVNTVGDFLVARWGFRRGSPAYREVLYGAWSYHRRLAPQYRTSC